MGERLGGNRTKTVVRLKSNVLKLPAAGLKRGVFFGGTGKNKVRVPEGAATKMALYSRSSDKPIPRTLMMMK